MARIYLNDDRKIKIELPDLSYDAKRFQKRLCMGLLGVALGCTVAFIVSYYQNRITTWQIGPGHVRSITQAIQSNEYYWVITFETDQGSIYTFGLCPSPKPPVWEGMHGKIYMDGCKLLRVDHLPPDDPFPQQLPVSPTGIQIHDNVIKP
jgi:hypothetical protein